MGIFDKTPIADLFRKIKALDENELFIEIMSLEDTQEFIVKLNTDQLRWKYINSDGVLLSKIGGGYSDSTLKKGKKAGKFKVDLYDTGQYHESFRITNIGSSGFEITSDPNKGDTNLLDEWGTEIEGLTFESLDKAARFLIQRYQLVIRKKLGIL